MKYYELLFEGHYDSVFGFVEGFLAGKEAGWNYFFSSDENIKEETLADTIKEWIFLKDKVHHVILDEDFYNAIKKTLDNKKSKFLQHEHIKSTKEIKTSSFSFKVETFGRKYGEEIKSLLKDIPASLKLEDYNPEEIVDKEAKGVELYAPEHDYQFHATGRLIGDLATLIEWNKKLDNHPLIEVEEIILGF